MRRRAAWCSSPWRRPAAPDGAGTIPISICARQPLPAGPRRVYDPVRTGEGLIDMWPFKRGGKPAVIDPCLGDDTARRLREAAGRGDWPAVSSLLAPVEDQDLRAFYVGVL